jgi:hypothetical protein
VSQELYVSKGYQFVYDDGQASTYFPTYRLATQDEIHAASEPDLNAGMRAFSAVLGPWAERTSQRLPLYKLRLETVEAVVAAALHTEAVNR